MVTFTAVTLILGEPFYEKLSEKVEETHSDVPTGHGLPLWKSILRSIKDGLITLGYVLLFTIPLFFLGFVPVIGQTVVPGLGALGLGLLPHGRAHHAGHGARGPWVPKSRFSSASAGQAPRRSASGSCSSSSSSSRWSR